MSDETMIRSALNGALDSCPYHGDDFARTGWECGVPRCDSCKQPYRVVRAREALTRVTAHQCTPSAEIMREVHALIAIWRQTTVVSAPTVEAALSDAARDLENVLEGRLTGLAALLESMRPLIVNDIIDTAEKLDRLPRGAVIGALDLVAWRGPHQWHCSDEQTPADPREHLVAMIEQGGAEMRLLGLLRSP